MKKVYLLVVVFVVINLVSCSKDDGIDPIKDGAFTSCGSLVIEGKELAVRTEFQTAFYHEDYVYVATTNGVFKNNPEKKEWVEAGLQGKEILSIYKHPITNRVFVGTRSDLSSTNKTLFYSDDLGDNWIEAADPIFCNLENSYEEYTFFTVRPNHPNHIFANLMGGAMIAISEDSGNSWKRMNDNEESYFGYTCCLAFLPGNANDLFQGAEAPLDFATLGKYTVDPLEPSFLKDFYYLVKADKWENRKPNEIKTYDFAPNSIYVGQEGALSKVTYHGKDDFTSKFIYKATDGGQPGEFDDKENLYSYIEAIWVDPKDCNHIIFGGGLNNDIQPMSLYETFDEGKTIKRYKDRLGFENPYIEEIVGIGNNKIAIIISEGNRMELFTFEF